MNAPILRLQKELKLLLKLASSTIILTLFFLLSRLVSAYQYPGDATGYVTDFADIFTDSEEQQLNEKLTNYEQQTSKEIAVVSIPALGDDTIETYAVKLFEDWGIGKQNQDNGVLLLIAPNDREVRIEVGYGLEGSLTDAQSHWIIQNQILPPFRDQQYFQGTNQAVDAIISTLGSPSISVYPSNPETNPESSFPPLFTMGAIFISWLASILARSKSWWLGGIIGGIIGIIITFMYGFIFSGLISFLILIPFGLLFDFLVSRTYQQNISTHRSIPWWAGGNWTPRKYSNWGGGGGFGGFGGGRSGGGGASGRW